MMHAVFIIPAEASLISLAPVRADIPLTEMEKMYVDLLTAQRVLREGHPDKKEALLRDTLSRVVARMDELCNGYLAPRNI